MLFCDDSMGVQVEEGSKPSLVQGNGRAGEGVWTLDREPNRLTVHDKGLFFFLVGGSSPLQWSSQGRLQCPPPLAHRSLFISSPDLPTT